MAKTTEWRNEYLLFLFNRNVTGTLATALGLTAPSSTNLYIALGVAGMNDGSAGMDVTKEAGGSAGGTYAGYTAGTRPAVALTTAGWTVSTNTAGNNAAITFPVSQAGDSLTLADVAICTGSTPYVDDAIYIGDLDVTLSIGAAGVIPEFTNDDDMIVTET